jgi:hypothetical protein
MDSVIHAPWRSVIDTSRVFSVGTGGDKEGSGTFIAKTQPRTLKLYLSSGPE